MNENGTHPPPARELTELERQILAPQIERVERLTRDLEEARGLLWRMLVLAEPAMGAAGSGCSFDPARMAFTWAAAQEEGEAP